MPKSRCQPVDRSARGSENAGDESPPGAPGAPGAPGVGTASRSLVAISDFIAELRLAVSAAAWPQNGTDTEQCQDVSRCVKTCQGLQTSLEKLGTLPAGATKPCPGTGSHEEQSSADQGNGHWEDHGSKGQEAKKRSTDINRNLQTVVGTGKLRQLPPPPSPPFDQFCRFHFQGSMGSCTWPEQSRARTGLSVSLPVPSFCAQQFEL